VFVYKPKSPVAAKIWLSVVAVDLAVAALTMSLWTGRLTPRFIDFVKDKSLAFGLGRFGDLDEVSVSNRRASVCGQNQKEHEGPNEPLSQIRNPLHRSPPQYPQAVLTLNFQNLRLGWIV
jgi:hypothetical protein